MITTDAADNKAQADTEDASVISRTGEGEHGTESQTDRQLGVEGGVDLNDSMEMGNWERHSVKNPGQLWTTTSSPGVA